MRPRPSRASPWEEALSRLSVAISEAASSYEARWTLAALRRVDPDIHGRLRRQIDLWLEASRRGSEEEIVTQGEALVRGYRRAVESMTASGEDDDAYVFGEDPHTGFVVAVVANAAAAEIAAVKRPGCVSMTIDEVAIALASIDQFNYISSIKRVFPGAVITDVR